jgi:hypothetical protein
MRWYGGLCPVKKRDSLAKGKTCMYMLKCKRRDRKESAEALPEGVIRSLVEPGIQIGHPRQVTEFRHAHVTQYGSYKCELLKSSSQFT